MNIEGQYKTITNNSEFNIRQYVTPANYFDPRKEILEKKNADYKNKPRQRKFKATTKHKPCYLDEQIKECVLVPSPDKYKTITNKEGFFDTDPKDQNLKRAKSADVLKKVDPKITRGSYIDDIEKQVLKHKPPGVGKYDITKDPYKRKILNLKQKEEPRKLSHQDDIKFISNAVPGAGAHNPHKQVPHLKMNRTDYKFYKAKHAEEEKKQSKHIKTKLGPTTYNPIPFNTFDSISKNKGKERSRWSHGSIDVRKGVRSQYKSPSPAEYKLMNTWASTNPQERENESGKVKIFERTSRSVKAFSVYH